MILSRGNSALGVHVEVQFNECHTIRTGEAGELTAFECGSCGSLVSNTDRHADFHYAIAARIGEGPPPGFRPL